MSQQPMGGCGIHGRHCKDISGRSGLLAYSTLLKRFICPKRVLTGRATGFHANSQTMFRFFSGLLSNSHIGEVIKQHG